MNMMLGVGPSELLIILLGLGGFSGLPLSLPPLPPDPVIERAAPDECLLHVALAGLAKPAAGSANRAEALLAEAEVQRFIGEVGSIVEKMLARQDAGADAGGPRFTPAMRSLAFTLLTRPAALTVDSFAPAVMLPAVQSAREAARRTVGMNNLRSVAQAMLVHEAASRKLPAAAICDGAGKPLLSWRVRMLPYLGEEELYEQFKLDEPWDSNHNKTLLEKMPKLFASPGDVAKPGMTRYLVPTGEGTIFPKPDTATTMAVVSDGLTRTILLVEAEAAKAVPLTKPEDLPVNLDKPHDGLKNARPTGFVAAFADGSVRVIPADVAAEVLAAAFTRSGGEQVEAP